MQVELIDQIQGVRQQFNELAINGIKINEFSNANQILTKMMHKNYINFY